MAALLWVACSAALAQDPGGAAAPAGAAAAPAKVAICAACHGPDGRATIQLNPILAGQSARYLFLELRDFKAGRRSDPQMSPIAQTLTVDDMHELSNWFAQQQPPRQNYTPDPQRVRLGQAKAAETLCSMCHLGEFKGQNEVPRVAGQNRDYIAKQLRAFKAHTRTNDAGTMTSVAGTLSDADIDNLADYISNL
ncbi:MAG: c-type cytochrome [Burkholderiales bacterium]|nr:c-type cytochrome [Burkholderiales bacterium]MDE1928104.1 c-type cytochrome [Burkholderiales bacterium]MDE2504810.1 c-type cytochrome [Burkholderiales bacterium]